VGVLQRFERRLEELVEGTFARVFKGEVHPTEIAVALQRETDDRKAIVSEDRVLVPNEFWVELGPRDHERLAPYADPLAEEFAAMIREHAQDQSYTFVGPVQVGFELVEELDTGVFRVRSSVLAAAKVESGMTSRPAPETTSGGSDGSLPGNPRLLLHPPEVGGSSPEARGRQREFALTARVLIGRGPDADLRLHDPGVSRRHALLREENGAFLVEDLGSTNGTLVNNVAVGIRELASGDRLRLGTTTLVFERDSAG